MIDTPKTITVPGIDQPLREQTLAEYVNAITDKEHLVHRELRELQRVYFNAQRIEKELVDTKQLLEKTRAALESEQKEVMRLKAPIFKISDPEPTGAINSPPKDPIPKSPCPVCGKLISVWPGPRASHMRRHENESLRKQIADPPAAA